MKIEAVILDFDGTVIDSEHIWQEVIQHKLTDSGYPIPNKFFYDCSGIGIDAFMVRLVQVLDIVDTDTEALRNSILTEVYENISTKAELNNGFYELSHIIKKHNLLYAICTASEYEMLIPTIERLKIKDFFDILHSAHGSENMKPHPDPYYKTAKKLGVDIKNCIVVEDSIPGIQSGISAGAKTFAIPASHDIEKVKLLDAQIVKDFTDVAKFISDKLTS
jgi:beta-phosphoglucomutase-like phosphatase (HAD superfamily)